MKPVESELTLGHQMALEIPATRVGLVPGLGAGDRQGERSVERPELSLQEFMIIECMGFSSQLLFHRPLQYAYGSFCAYMYTCVGCICVSACQHTSAHI